jgi:hypothetical protein
MSGRRNVRDAVGPLIWQEKGPASRSRTDGASQLPMAKVPMKIGMRSMARSEPWFRLAVGPLLRGCACGVAGLFGGRGAAN